MATNDVTLLDSIAAPDATDIIAVCTVDATHVLAVFGGGSSIYKKVQVFEVDSFDGSFTAIGTALTVATSAFAINSRSRIVMLDSTTAAIVYATGSTSQSIRTLSINLSTYAVTNKGAAYTGMFAFGGFANLYAISATRLLHVGNDTSADGWVTMLAVDASTGDISSLSSAIEFEPSTITAVDLLFISSSHFVIAWAGVGSDGFVQTFSFDSTSMTAMDSPLEYDTTEGRDVSIGKLDTSTGLGTRYCLFRRSAGVGAMQAYYSASPSGAVERVAIVSANNYGSGTAENNASKWIDDEEILLVWSQTATDYAQVVKWSSPNMVVEGSAISFSPSYTAGNSQLAKLANDLYVWAHGDLYSLAVERPGGVIPLALSETVEMDSAVKKLPSRRLSETIEVTDTARARISAKILSDSVEASDSLSRTLGRFLLDSVNVSDAFAKMKVIFLGLSDSISVTDIISRTISRVFTETVNATDAVLRTLGRTLSESVNVAASMLKVVGKVFTETLAVSDSVIRALLISFSETVDVIASKMHTLGRSFAESVLVASSMIKTVGKSLGETVFAVDSILRSLGRSLVEAITALDRGGIVIGKFFNESVSVAASITRSVGKFFTERIKATVHIRFKINGFTAGVWAKVTRVASSWTGSARVTSAWSKVSKITSTWRKVDRQE